MASITLCFCLCSVKEERIQRIRSSQIDSYPGKTVLIICPVITVFHVLTGIQDQFI